MKITFLGAGNMGGAIARGLIIARTFDSSQMQIIDKNPSVCEDFAQLGLNTAPVTLGEVVVLAVKPWQLDDVTPLLADFNGIIISIISGVPLAHLTPRFAAAKCARVIPNTAVELLAGVSFVTAVDDELARWTAEIFSSLGSAFVVDEKEFDACTSIGSCGLAFALRYARASMEGAVEMGLRPLEAQKIVAGVLRGAAALLEKEGAHPESEIDKITTPGGITIRGLNAMEKAGFTNAVIAGVKSAK